MDHIEDYANYTWRASRGACFVTNTEVPPYALRVNRAGYIVCAHCCEREEVTGHTAWCANCFAGICAPCGGGYGFNVCEVCAEGER